jgi:hypothetical protein
MNGTLGATTPSPVVATTVKANTTIGVGAATPSASGAGITFPATQSASTDANTLDDYEEGTWTPTQGAGLTVVGTFSSGGNYTKIGNIVVLTGFVAGATSVAFASGGAIICGGLPFTVGGSALQVGNGINSANTVTTSCFANSTSVNSGGSFAANAQYHFSVSYTV